jgi:hypothetical protein
MSLQDENNIVQYGEKAHMEYGWSKNMRERMIQFHFQLVRTTSSSTLYHLQNTYYQLINELMFHSRFSTSSLDKEISCEFLILLYKMIGQTRDIIDGKGEYTLSYMMIYVWYFFHPELACYALISFVQNDSKEHPYGSWKDMKYFCHFCRLRGLPNDHFLIRYTICLMNDQLKRDLEEFKKNKDTKNLSLVAKWIPREKSNKFAWLYDLLTRNFFSHYFETTTSDESYRKAQLKSNTEYRKIISLLNQQVDTLQIKQCNKKWSEIDFNKVTSISLAKQNSAFLNITKMGNQRTYWTDRILCAENMKNYLQTNPTSIMKGKRLGVNDFVKQAMEVITYGDDHPEKEEFQLKKQILNAQWINHSSQNETLGKMIAMVDTSGSMEGEPKNAAIGLGIRVAEKSILGKRVMTFSAKPTWVNLEECNDFVSMVDRIKKAESGTNTNFYAALDKILDAIVEANIAPEEVQDLMLIVFSDMQMDTQQGKAEKNTLYDTMKKKYEETGKRLYGKPLKAPHILFWNLRSTNGFPTISNQSNCSMISGFNPSLLNLFCKQGFDSLQACSPWALVVKSLENKRYQPLEKKSREFFSSY